MEAIFFFNLREFGQLRVYLYALKNPDFLSSIGMLFLLSEPRTLGLFNRAKEKGSGVEICGELHSLLAGSLED